jgi:hypothetical protein
MRKEPKAMAVKKPKLAKESKKPKFLEANGLFIKDLKGKVRASLNAASLDGHVSLNLYGDPDSQLAISAGPDGHAGMDLFYENKVALSVGVTKEGAGISICDQEGRPSFFISASTKRGCGRIRIFHEGKLVWKTT